MNPTAHEMFEILVREHGPSVFAFLRAAGHANEEADDLLQESLIVAWRRLDDFDRRRSFGPWLRGIAAKVSLARRRNHASEPINVGDEQILEHLQHRFDQLDQVAGFEFTEKIGVLRKCLESLSETDRKIVATKYQANATLAEIASRLSMSLDAVKKRIQRARTSLKNCIVGKLNEIELGLAPGESAL